MQSEAAAPLSPCCCSRTSPSSPSWRSCRCWPSHPVASSGSSAGRLARPAGGGRHRRHRAGWSLPDAAGVSRHRPVPHAGDLRRCRPAAGDRHRRADGIRRPLPSLGSFLAGVVLADGEYRHELEADIEPFKGLLLGLFFMSVGAGIDFNLFCRPSPVIPALVIGLMVLKWLVLMGLGFVIRLSPTGAGPSPWPWPKAGVRLRAVLVRRPEQGTAGSTISLLTLVVALSMALTPLLLILNDRVIQPWFDYRNQSDTPNTNSPSWWNARSSSPASVASVEIVGRLLHGHGIGTTIPRAGCQPDRDAEKVRLPGVL